MLRPHKIDASIPPSIVQGDMSVLGKIGWFRILLALLTTELAPSSVISGFDDISRAGWQSNLKLRVQKDYVPFRRLRLVAGSYKAEQAKGIQSSN